MRLHVTVFPLHQPAVLSVGAREGAGSGPAPNISSPFQDSIPVKSELERHNREGVLVQRNYAGLKQSSEIEYS